LAVPLAASVAGVDYHLDLVVLLPSVDMVGAVRVLVGRNRLALAEAAGEEIAVGGAAPDQGVAPPVGAAFAEPLVVAWWRMLKSAQIRRG
jgi:hypothetical protein